MIETITAEEFDRRFDAGEDMSEYLNLENGEMLDCQNEAHRVNYGHSSLDDVELDIRSRE